MDPIVLKTKTNSGEILQATFLPEKGMNMISFKKGDTEVIDQSTLPLFEERFAGLGALIGPHFHRRNPEIIPIIKDESLFPHIARVKAKGPQDPFSHGIARYAPWKAQFTENTFKATLSGKDEWHGVTLASIEGQNFKMEFSAELTQEKLKLSLSVVSDTDSIVGLHYYYSLPNGKGRIISDVKSHYLDNLELKPIPSSWEYNEKQELIYDLTHSADYTFHSIHPTSGKILLETDSYRLLTHYHCNNEENSWQLYHPAGASFVCIEPLSSKNPRRPNLSVSSLNISLKIF